MGPERGLAGSSGYESQFDLEFQGKCGGILRGRNLRGILLFRHRNAKGVAMKKSRDARRRMTDQELDEVKQMLLKRKSMLWQEISEDIEEDARGEYQDLIQSIRDGSDRAMAELEETMIFSYVKLKVQEIEQIEEALKRIENRKYGSCLKCGGWIRPARLEAVPYAVRCRSCQEKQEKINGA